MNKVLLLALVLCAVCTACMREPEQSASWVVVGRVTDANGRGMTGVTVFASCGWGTLMATGMTNTDSAGNYLLKFRPTASKRSLKMGVVEAAIIRVEKADYYEKNLSRQGDLRVSGALADPSTSAEFAPERIILPNKPRRLDFVMLPAATITGRVVDEQGQPVSSQQFDVDGAELGPAGSVLGQFNPDENGRFIIRDVPCKTYWFSPADGDLRGLKSNSITFDAPGSYEVEVVLNRHRKELASRILKAPAPMDGGRAAE